MRKIILLILLLKICIDAILATSNKSAEEITYEENLKSFELLSEKEIQEKTVADIIKWKICKTQLSKIDLKILKEDPKEEKWIHNNLISHLTLIDGLDNIIIKKPKKKKKNPLASIFQEKKKPPINCFITGIDYNSEDVEFYCRYMFPKTKEEILIKISKTKEKIPDSSPMEEKIISELKKISELHKNLDEYPKFKEHFMSLNPPQIFKEKELSPKKILKIKIKNLSNIAGLSYRFYDYKKNIDKIKELLKPIKKKFKTDYRIKKILKKLLQTIKNQVKSFNKQDNWGMTENSTMQFPIDYKVLENFIKSFDDLKKIEIKSFGEIIWFLEKAKTI